MRRKSEWRLGPLDHEQMDAQEACFQADLKARGWKKRECDAAAAGWEYVLDQCCTADGRYSIDGMEGDGSDEARDMAVAMADGGEIRKRDVEMFADLVYEGVVAARHAVEAGTWDRRARPKEKLFEGPSEPTV